MICAQLLDTQNGGLRICQVGECHRVYRLGLRREFYRFTLCEFAEEANETVLIHHVHCTRSGTVPIHQKTQKQAVPSRQEQERKVFLCTKDKKGNCSYSPRTRSKTFPICQG